MPADRRPRKHLTNVRQQRQAQQAEVVSEEQQPEALRETKKDKLLQRRQMWQSKFQVRTTDAGKKKKPKGDLVKQSPLNLTVIHQVLPPVVDAPKTEVVAPIKSRSRVKSGKGRQHALKRESEQMRRVLANPQFKNDPVAALSLHLHNTIAKQ